MADVAPPIAPEPLPLPHIDRRGGTPWSERAPFVLMMVMTLGLFGWVGCLMFHAVPTDNHDILVGVTSSITTVWIAGGAFFFGSSAGAAKRESTTANLTNALAAAVPAPDRTMTTTTSMATTAVPVTSVKPIP